MNVELLDRRLAEVLSEQEYVILQARVENVYRRIEKKASMAVLGDLYDLVALFRNVEKRLLDDRLGKPSADWAQGTMATLE